MTEVPVRPTAPAPSPDIASEPEVPAVRAPEPPWWQPQAWRGSGRPWGAAGFALALVVLVAYGLYLRLTPPTDLWLDEAQSVAIARLPLGGHGFTLFDGLRQDGSPPLYYLLLHGWIQLFGQSGTAVRSLSLLLNLLCLPPLWLLARRLLGVRSAWLAVALFILSPFAAYYATETRMYSLLVLLALLGGLAIERTLRQPTAWSVLAVLLCSGLISLTHYWSLYSLVTVAALLLLGGLRGRTRMRRRGCWLALLGLVGGCVVFVPWLPDFIYQVRHTGTPWGEPASFAAVVHAFAEWSGGPTSSGRATLVVSCALLAFAVFGTPAGRRQVLIDLKGHEPGRSLLFLSLATLILAVAVGQVVGNAWADRYTAVAFVPYLLALSLGPKRLVDIRIWRGAVLLLALLSAVAATHEVHLERTQAGEAAAVLRQNAHAGDVVLVCPDQLGPALARESLPAGLRMHVIPTFDPPGRVDWVDYAERNRSADGGALARRALAEAGPGHAIWLVYNDTYRTYENLCPAVRDSLRFTRPESQLLGAKDPKQSYEQEEVFGYAPQTAR